MLKWSQINTTDPLFHVAIRQMDINGCDYHNIDHISVMYQYLHDTDEPYDEALDWAILYHDVVYDEHPGKEERSAKFFAEHALRSMSTHFVSQVEELIMATKFHIVENPHWSPIIRADLHSLTSPTVFIYNYMSIMNESIKLYGIDEQTFAENNIIFMNGLYQRMNKNMEIDSLHKDFYSDIRRGIMSTINMSRIIKGEL